MKRRSNKSKRRTNKSRKVSHKRIAKRRTAKRLTTKRRRNRKTIKKGGCPPVALAIAGIAASVMPMFFGPKTPPPGEVTPGATVVCSKSTGQCRQV